LKVEAIDYSAGGERFSGALVYDDQAALPLPAMLMAPNWLGVTEEALERAAMLAGHGYVVFAVDMFGEGIRPAGPQEAGALVRQLLSDSGLSRRRILAAFDTMIAEGTGRGLINKYRAAVGYCLGGANVLELARTGADLAAVVSIHGDLRTEHEAEPGVIKAAVLILHGAPDPASPKSERDTLEAELTRVGAKWQMLIFSGVLHAYTYQDVLVPGVAAYDGPATRQSHRLMHAFIQDAFAGRL
jgi:dienelactone hydrolase